MHPQSPKNNTCPVRLFCVGFSALSRSPSSSGLGHRPFTAVTGVRTPMGTPNKTTKQVSLRCRS
ncbi:protein of unknown function [Acidithiobacillus ferrivorans]|uniref:Uncharacterized protein n=1 Tax=Acidithiobacillus ferrivorans TaxID=160808 RepID=A0A060UXC1_9PROT|nr:hypothetical protein AFERRI_530278 [Acidithiobacillus ferrivorans]SMH67742.1 protein of unknown function [Acidithiobacillus ferrivorans]